MPNIRKKTSNRVKTRDREKFKKKVRDGKKKKTKLAKKKPQWKSKKLKDPGIPNDFPYKDQILAEIQEQRRIAAEDKRRIKEERENAQARAKSISRGEIVEDESDFSREDDGAMGEVGGSDDGELENEKGGTSKGRKDLKVDSESIAGLSAKIINVNLKRMEQHAAEISEEEPEEEIPVLVHHDLPNLVSVLEMADVVLQVLDARDPLSFRIKHVEEFANDKGKKTLFVLNKIDRCPREAVAVWTSYLRTEQPTFLFRSASTFLPEEQAPHPLPQVRQGKGKAKSSVADAVGANSIIACLHTWANQKGDDEVMTVAVVGLANAGKSSLINSLLKKSCLPVYTPASSLQSPSTTVLPQGVTLDVKGRKIAFIDTPGLTFVPSDEPTSEDNRTKDILLRSKGRIDRLKDPNPSISHIVSRANNEDLMLMYSLPAFSKGDSTSFLSGIARTNQLVKKKGALDLTGAARIVLRDWNSGKFARFTTPPPTSPPNETAINVSSHGSGSNKFTTEFYAEDDAILMALSTRKEMRKKGGLVKVSSGSIEERKVAMEQNWDILEASEDENADGDYGGGPDEDGVATNDDAEEEDEVSEEDDHDSQSSSRTSIGEEVEAATLPPVLSSRKQKRKRGQDHFTSLPSLKKVSLGSVTVFSVKGKRDIEPTRSILKKPSARVVDCDSSKNDGKVANVKQLKKASTVGKKDANEPEAYEFGKFF